MAVVVVVVVVVIVVEAMTCACLLSLQEDHANFDVTAYNFDEFQSRELCKVTNVENGRRCNKAACNHH